jgi:hypothetical protein
MKPSELLEDPGAWCQEWQAKTATDIGCAVEVDMAVKWSIDGALLRYTQTQEEFDAAIKAVCTAIGKPGWGVEQLADWNDDPDRTHKEVLDVLKRAGL